MVLHLIHDDKILPRMISQFEEVSPGNNVYICVIRACDNQNLRYLKDNPHVIRSDSNEIRNIPWKIIDKVCIHYLSFSKIRYYSKLCLRYGLFKCKVLWVIWSGDIYDIIEKKGFELYSSGNSYLTLRKIKKEGTSPLKSLLKTVSTAIRRTIAYYVQCIFMDRRIDYIVCNSEDEFGLFKRYVSFSKCKGLLRYNYYPLEDILGSLVDKRINGNSIIIGNSASESNNHEYILDFIKDIDIGDRKIYLPLSYGEDAEYISIVEGKYKGIPNTVILKEFMPLAEYNKLLLSCSSFIYGSYRSEGWGNMLVALYLGGKVYVSEKSFLSRYLKTEGYKFFITESIKDTFNTPLTETEIENNRQVAMKAWSREQNKKNIEYICNL